jgi:hypothetical protein
MIFQLRMIVKYQLRKINDGIRSAFAYVGAKNLKEFQEKAVLKDKLKTLSDYEKDAKKSFQHWIRLRDKNLPCISCGKSLIESSKLL